MSNTHTVTLPAAVDLRGQPVPELSVTFSSDKLAGCDVRQIHGAGLRLLLDCREAGVPVPERIEYFDSWGGLRGTVITTLLAGSRWAVQLRPRVLRSYSEALDDAQAQRRGDVVRFPVPR